MKNIVSFLYKNIFNRDIIKIYNCLKVYKDKDFEQKHKYQVNKLSKVVSLIPNIPYYKEYTLNSASLTYDEFIKLPVLTKDDIRVKGKELINSEYNSSDKPYVNTSGGSTGEPVSFYRTNNQNIHGGANYFYANYINNVNIYDFSIDLWGAERDMHHVNENFNLKSFLHNKIMLNTFVLSDDIICNYIERINRLKPKFIKAYVHSIYDIAKFINKNKIKINIKPIIHCTTGPLYPEMKTEIKKAFNNTHVYSFYGSREVSAIASQDLEERSFQVLFDNVFVEILDSNNNPVKMGVEGEVVITTLNNFYMPLIRYKIGDRAIKGDKINFGCLVIENIVGRTLGVIHTMDGRKIDGQFFTTLFFNKSGIKNFQLVQESISELTLKIIKNNNFDQKELDLILKRMKNELGEVNIKVDFCQKINLTSTGKIMYVYSKI